MIKIYSFIIFLFISVGQLVAQCNPPTALFVSTKTNTTATIGFVTGGASAWQVQYGPIGFILGNGTTVNVSSNTPTLTGLSGSTTYEFYVRDDCGAQGFSTWSGPQSFNTLCTGVATVPVSYNFETSDWVKPTTFNVPGDIAKCWVSTPLGSALQWSTGQPFFTNNFTGPSVDHTTGLSTGKFVHMDVVGGFSTNLNTGLRMPEMYLGGVTSPELSFWYHMFGNQIDKLEVQLKKRGGSWTTLKTISGQQQTSKSQAWQEEIVSLNAYATDTVFIRFRGFRTTSFGQLVDISIDDVKVQAGPTCPKPSSFTLVSKTNTSVTLGWTTGGATNWQVEYGAPGFVAGSGTRVTVNSNPATITGLTANTNYAFFVRDSCSSTDQSDWTGPVLATTDCNSFVAPFTEDFNGTDWGISSSWNVPSTINNCWTRNNTTVYFWDVGPPIFQNFQTGPVTALGGSGKFLYAKRLTFNATPVAQIETPLIDVTNLTSPELSFWYHMFGTDITSLEVLVDSGNGFNSVSTLTGQLQSSRTDPWLEKVVNLSAYAGTTIKIKFRGTGFANNLNRDRMAIDEVSVKEAPTCPKPQNLVINSISATSVNIGWQSGGASNWIVKYKSQSGTPQYVSVSSNPAIITGLTAQTGYTIWVRDSCGVADVSDWTQPIQFTTNCAPKSTPYFENFDANGFTPAASFGTAGVINGCWNRSDETGYIWDVGKLLFTNNNTGPANDHTSGSGNFLQGNSIGFANQDSSEITTPLIDLTNLTSPEFSFWYHMFGTNIVKLGVYINNGTGWNHLSTISGQQQTSNSDAWLEKVINLSSYANDTVQIKFVCERSSFGFFAQMAIDDIGVYELPSCPKPTNLALTSALSTSLLIDWTTGGASNWLVKYKTASGSFNYQTANSKPHSITSLTPDTEYEIWVKDSCGTGDVSFWVGPLMARTACSVSSLPYNESFDGSDWTGAVNFLDLGTISTCWSRTNSNFYRWIPRQGASFIFNSGPNNDHSGSGKYMMTNRGQFNTTDNQTDFESPWVDMAGTGSPELTFWYHMFGLDIDKLEVYVEKPDGTSTLSHTISGQQHTAKTSAWTKATVGLNAFIGDTVKFVFRGYRTTTSGGFNVNIAIDDIMVEDLACNDPTNLAMVAVTGTTAEVSWSGAGANSNIQYGLQGFTLGQGTYLPNVTSPHVITNLNPLTSYDVYVKDSCGTNNVSQWVGPITVTTTCLALSADFTFGTNYLNLSLDGLSTAGNIATYAWDYGDGNSGSGPTPSHTYSSGSTYPVTLIVTDSCGSSDTIVKNVKVCEKPVAVIAYSINGLTVNYDGSGSTGAVNYLWDLDNGGNNILPSPSYTYSSNGTYNVSLIVTNDCGESDTAFATVVICDEPTAFFTYKIISSGGGGMTVDFDGSLSQGVTSHIWRFGDGNSNTTTLTPTHVYATPGLFYEVTLITYSSCGASDTMQYKLQDVVSIDEWDLGEVKAFPNPAKENLRVSFIEQTDDLDFTWYNLLGAEIEVNAEKVTNLLFEFDVSGLKPGQYLLLITSDGKRKAMKIIVE